MKYLLTFFLFLAFSLSIFAQTPEKMSYQAIIRNSDNALVIDSNVSLKILIRQGSPNGTAVYEENHVVSTNTNGLVTLEIGTGNAVQGNFTNIAWDQEMHFIETQVDPTGGSNYNIVGVSQLLSVPYALHAKSAESITGPIVATPYKAEIIPLTSSRNIISSDINNTIACTTTSTFTIPSGFSAMEVGDTINLEAHNGAVLTVNASTGVTLNYSNSGSAQFNSKAGNVRFGLLRKSGQNAYIISGQ
ncbi:hypothetical protein SAMN05428642_103534 [Flaviramulus basaltis]|uniref:Uncharacterized protein n=1 Tax=Flaviramulus basaltis TaxID=369401 RepID=A0A1K2INU2_9FLAO|nr:hypothetical protein [Flaviramulus basaltis]SFZ94047.1 hypothetical protein SAMN05428642_103534 [Flaviramulus basaltis]